MWKKKIKHKKMQFIGMGLMLMSIALIFATCLGFTLELRHYAKTRFAAPNCPDAYVFTHENISLEGNFSNEAVRSNIISVDALKGKEISMPLRIGDVSPSSMNFILCEMPEVGFETYMQRVAGDLISKTPQRGEIWIDQALANTYQIQIGDEFILETKPASKLKVSAIYTATFAPVERITIKYCMVNQETIASLVDEVDGGLLAVNLKDKSAAAYDALDEGNPYDMHTFSREEISSYVTDISGVLGGVATAAVFVVFLASLMIIQFMINNDLQKEYRSIGIYKSLGYKNEQIKSFYLKGYLVVGIFAFCVGALLAAPIVLKLGNGITKTLGGFRLSGTYGVVFLITVALMIFILWLRANKYLKKVRHISPVEAIRTGTAVGDYQKGKSFIKYAKTPLETAINELMKHRKRSLVSIGVLTISFYLLCFFSAGYFTCDHICENATKWLAVPRYDAVISGTMDEYMIEEIEKKEGVKYCVAGNFFYFPNINLPSYEGYMGKVEVDVLSEIDETITGIKLHNGRAPKLAEEIAVSTQLLKKLGLKVGDYLKISLGEHSESYLITADYASIEVSPMMMRLDGMKLLNPDYEPDVAFIQLNDGVDEKAFCKEIEKEYTELIAEDNWGIVESAISSIERMITSVMLILLIVLVIFAILCMTNVMVMNFNDKRRYYGILKALGFTERYISQQNLWFSGILLSISLGCAVNLHALISKTLFAVMVFDALQTSWILTGIICLGTVIGILGVTLVMNYLTRKISPVELMEV